MNQAKFYKKKKKNRNVCDDKDFAQEISVPTLSRITVSAQCWSPVPVILNARIDDQLYHMLCHM